MSRSFKTLIVFALAVGLLLGLGSFSKTEAVKIYGNFQGNYTELSGCNGYCSYSAAYEYYGNQSVIAGLHYLSPFTPPSENPIRIAFQPGQTVPAGDTISLVLTNAKFISPGGTSTAPLRYCLVTGGGAVVAITPLTPAPTYPSSTIYLVATGPGLLTTQTYDLAVCNNAGTALAAAPNAAYETNVYPSGTNRPARDILIQIDPNLKADCNNTKNITIAYNHRDDCCTATLITIKPKDDATLALNFNAELDSDNQFMTFIKGNDKLDLCCEGGACDCSGGVCISKKKASACPYPDRWVLGEPFNARQQTVVRVSFDIESLYDEPGIDKITTSGTTLTCKKAEGSNKKWTCSSDCMACPECGENNFEMYVELKGNVENVPTIWTVKNAFIDKTCLTDPRVKDICCFIKTGYAGAWWGGVEAIVPFVRSSSAAETYIKLFNRYSKDATLYAEVFNNSSGAVIVPLKQITGKEKIPAGGAIQITGADLKSICPTCDWDFGQAVKFLVRVPSQQGCNTETGTITPSISLNPLRVTATYSGVSCNNNPYDPYIEGIVVSVAGGQQRSIPLLFKAFKQGQYNQ